MNTTANLFFYMLLLLTSGFIHLTGMDKFRDKARNNLQKENFMQ
jgi:hypothetical protein